MAKKRCGKCRTWLPTSNFSKNAGAKDGYQHYCRACSKAVKAMHRYGVTQQDFDLMLEAQGGKCAICLASFDTIRPVIDHCHSTGLVRGLLCNACNVLLGQAKDSKEILQGAIGYLEKRSKR